MYEMLKTTKHEGSKQSFAQKKRREDTLQKILEKISKATRCCQKREQAVQSSVLSSQDPKEEHSSPGMKQSSVKIIHFLLFDVMLQKEQKKA